jgi:sugar phosphate isomerase/epimerase
MSTGSPPISVQLYSVRDQAAKDFEGVLRRLGEIGFVGVELAGFHDLSPKQYAAIVEESGMVTSSAHVNDLSPDGFNAALDDLQEIGCNVAVCAFLPPERFADVDAINASADALNKANEIAKSRGVSLGYHNHWWEFSTVLDGRTAWSTLNERLDSTVLRRDRHLLGHPRWS